MKLGCPFAVEDVLTEICKSVGIDPQKFFAGIGEQAVKDQLKANTDEAVRAGAFGCPTFVVGDELFFGQDRLEFVSRALEND